ncbi:unnamed protein product [Cochlearia groenlandica]
MALNKNNLFFLSLIILVSLFGVSLGGTMHVVGDSQGWVMMGVDYKSWSSSKTFHVGDTLLFKYIYDDHNVNEVTLDNFELCETSNALARYETGSDTVTLTKPGVYYYICGFPDHCRAGQKFQILVLPASLGHVVAPVQSPSPSQPPLALEPVISHAPQYHMGPRQAPTPVPRPVRSPSSSQSPLASGPVISHAPQYHMGPRQAPTPVRSPSSSQSPLALGPVSHAPQYQMGPAPAPVPRPVRSPSSSQSPLALGPVSHAPQYQMGPAPAPVQRPVQSPSSSLSPLAYSPVIRHPPTYQMGPGPASAPQSVASRSSVWMGLGLSS